MSSFERVDDDLVDRHLERIGVPERPSVDLEGLSGLMLAHLLAVSFDNLDVYDQRGVTTEPTDNIAKIVERRRGGWCFELNGAFGALLHSLGFDVRGLGAAVLLAGPTDVVDHLTLEVRVEDRPWLVDVGFGEAFIRPLDLSKAGPQDGGIADFEFLASPKGTTLAKHVDGVPEAQFRFKRVTIRPQDLQPTSDRMFGDPESFFRREPYATKLSNVDGSRITLTPKHLKRVAADGTESIDEVTDFDAQLLEHFGLDRSG